VQNPGDYLVSYSIRTTAPIIVSSSVFVGDAAAPSTVFTPTTATDNYSASSILTLAANNILRLTLTAPTTDVTATLQAANGANMVVVRTVTG